MPFSTLSLRLVLLKWLAISPISGEALQASALCSSQADDFVKFSYDLLQLWKTWQAGLALSQWYCHRCISLLIYVMIWLQNSIGKLITDAKTLALVCKNSSFQLACPGLQVRATNRQARLRGYIIAAVGHGCIQLDRLNGIEEILP